MDDYITCINLKGVEFYRKKNEINPLTILLLIKVFVINFMLAIILIHICSKLCKLGIKYSTNQSQRTIFYYYVNDWFTCQTFIKFLAPLPGIDFSIDISDLICLRFEFYFLVS